MNRYVDLKRKQEENSHKEEIECIEDFSKGR